MWGCSEPKLINMGFTSIHICKGSEINVHDTVFGDIVNDVNYQNFKQGVQDNYNSLIQNRINPQSQENAK